MILQRLREHLDETANYFKETNIVGCWLQGSQNYGLEYEKSDVDSKLIVTPSLKDICLNSKPVSTTHVMPNDEHVDWKDVRLYIETFRKQNLNFMEILFTDYYFVNPLYVEQWDRLIARREDIARMNEYRAVKTMKGILLEKWHAMEHRYPSKVDIIDKYGYDGKQVSHLLRVNDYLKRYIAGESYKDCLHPSPDLVPRIMDYKKLDRISLEEAREEGKLYLDEGIALADQYCADRTDEENAEMRDLLQDVCCEIIKISIKEELRK